MFFPALGITIICADGSAASGVPYPKSTLQKRIKAQHKSACETMVRKPQTCTEIAQKKSAHTVLAVKACLLGGNSNTKFSITCVDIADSTLYQL